MAEGSHWRLEDVELCYGVVEHADLEAGESSALAVSDSSLQQTLLIRGVQDRRHSAADLVVMIAADEIENLVIDLDLEELQAMFLLDMVLVARIKPVRSKVYLEIVEWDRREEVGAR